jgi:hypothetical protein
VECLARPGGRRLPRLTAFATERVIALESYLSNSTFFVSAISDGSATRSGGSGAVTMAYGWRLPAGGEVVGFP